MNAKRIWLLSAYRADSHAIWADRLTEMTPEFDWRRFELPGRHFAWRIRGNPLSWLDALDGPRPDAIVATSMVDLTTIRGLNPRLVKVPALLYFHENQFAWPRSDRQTTSVEAQMVQLYAALCADRVLFNSRFNRSTFLDGVEALMARMPDRVPAGLRDRLERKSDVLPVPVPAPAAKTRTRRNARLIVWNHRWEYDKDPDTFAEAMIRLASAGVEFRLALLGPRGGRPIAALDRLRAELPDRIEIDDCPPRSEYETVLERAGIVVSTARHEFQGLAVMEAVRAGCVPLVPDALCYPEWFPPAFRYPAASVAQLVARLTEWLNGTAPPPPELTPLDRQASELAWPRELRALLATAASLD